MTLHLHTKAYLSGCLNLCFCRTSTPLSVTKEQKCHPERSRRIDTKAKDLCSFIIYF